MADLFHLGLVVSIPIKARSLKASIIHRAELKAHPFF
jgi:hypothetical protein